MKNYNFIIFFVILIVLGIIFPSNFGIAKNLTSKIILSPAKIVTSLVGKIEKFFSTISKIGTLTKENAYLLNKNLQLESDLANLNEVKHENEILKSELGFSQNQKDYKLIPAQIVGGSPTSFLQDFKIDKGTNDQIALGDPVLSQGFLIGQISSIEAKSAIVELIDSSKSIIPVTLQESRGTGILKGGLKGLVVEDIAIDISIKINEVVLSSGLADIIKPGFPIGRVEKIISSSSEIFQKLTVKSPIELNKLEIVFVVK